MQSAEKQCAVQDWGRACGNFRKSVEAHNAIYGDTDKRTKTVMLQLQVTQKNTAAYLLNTLYFQKAERTRDDDMIDSIPDNEVNEDDDGDSNTTKQ